MLKWCGLELVGKHHSGIDDARNIAKVVVKMLELGFEFNQSMVLNKKGIYFFNKLKVKK